MRKTMSQLPLEIVNKILVMRERHPVATLISNLMDDLIPEVYQMYGGNYPEDDEEEQGEYYFDDIRDEITLYEIAVLTDILKEIEFVDYGEVVIDV